MRLRKEESDEILEDSLEYKAALKSVIRSEIQNLLQKLAIETGEESIVITTNVSTGTYNHLGSYLGREYLQDGGMTVEMLCENFMTFCKSIQVDCVSPQDSERLNSLAEQFKSVSQDTINASLGIQLSPPSKPTVNSHVRKRQLNKSHVQDCPPSKRKNLIGSHSPRAVYESSIQNLLNDENRHDTSLVKGDNPYLVQGKKSSPEVSKTVPWIKVEPADDYSAIYPNCENGESQNKPDNQEIHDTTSDWSDSDKPKKQNRRKNLIPLANIFKKYGNLGNKVKAEPVPALEDKPSSILRNLYENSPIYQISDLFSANSDSETTEKVPVTLPSNLAENIAGEDFSGTTENLVLSGYYDSDVYPTYRHRQKHLLNKTGSEKKPPKDKTKDKPISASPNGSASENPSLKTYESGGRLVYSCDVCKRELSHLTSYRRHMKLHTLERPHVCPICQKGFIRKYHCIDHLNKHHKGVRFDPESLRVLDLPASVENEDQAAYSPGDLNTSEYNYTLDQSLAGSEAELSVNENIDQSASTMLSELAKSAAKLNQSENVKEKNLLQSGFLFGSLNESKENLSQSEGMTEVNQSDVTSAEEERKPEKGTRKGGMPTALEKIVAELRSAPKNKHKKESGGTNLSDLQKYAEEIPAHLQKYADEENWICLLCDESFSDRGSFYNHMAGHESAEIVKCNRCPRGFISREIYDEHLVIEHGEGDVNDMDI